MITTQLSKYCPEEAKQCLLHVGAHLGGEADDYERAGFRRICWVEADPQTFEALEERMSERGSGRHACFQALLTSRSGGRRKLHRFSNNGGSNSIYRATELFHESMGDVHESGDPVELEETTLDEFVEARNFEPTTLVVDVQGAEGEVLAGASRTLLRLSVVEVEISRQALYEGAALFGEIDKLLSDAGFSRVTHVPWHGDVVYIRPQAFGSASVAALRLAGISRGLRTRASILVRALKAPRRTWQKAVNRWRRA